MSEHYDDFYEAQADKAQREKMIKLADIRRGTVDLLKKLDKDIPERFRDNLIDLYNWLHVHNAPRE